MSRVLVAGATGHLGREVLRHLKGQGHWVRALARNPRGLKAVHPFADDTFIGDLTQPGTLPGICDGIDVVFSSAGLSVSAKRQKDRASFTSVDYHFAFGIATSKVHRLAPTAGSRTLESYYAEVVSQIKAKP